MPRGRPKKSEAERARTAAERALDAAIAEATAKLTQEIAVRDGEIRRLNGVLSQIAVLAGGAARSSEVKTGPHYPDGVELPAKLTTMLNSGDAIDDLIAQGQPQDPDKVGRIDEEDEMGAGRWV